MSFSRDHILREVKRTANENGGKPLGRLAFFAATGIKEHDWRGRFWARWNDVLRDAGFGPNKLVEARDDAELLDRMAALAVELGSIPTNTEMRLRKRSDPTFPNEKTYSRFGTKAQLLGRLRAHCEASDTYRGLLPLLDGGDTVQNALSDRSGLAETEVGFVYLLRSGRYYKVGRSNAAGRREREIALQLPEKAKMAHVIRTDDPVGIEAYWHRRFADRRKNGEWFDLTAKDVSAFRRRKFM